MKKITKCEHCGQKLPEPTFVITAAYGDDWNLTKDKLTEASPDGESRRFLFRKGLKAALAGCDKLEFFEGEKEVNFHYFREDSPRHPIQTQLVVAKNVIEIGCVRFEDAEATALRAWLKGAKK